MKTDEILELSAMMAFHCIITLEATEELLILASGNSVQFETELAASIADLRYRKTFDKVGVSRTIDSFERMLKGTVELIWCSSIPSAAAVAVMSGGLVSC